jgi:hypothetical protein
LTFDDIGIYDFSGGGGCDVDIGDAVVWWWVRNVGSVYWMRDDGWTL